MPEVPELLFDAAQQIRRFEQIAPAIQSTAQQMVLLEQRQQQSRKRSRIAVIALLAMALLAPQWGAALTTISWQAVALVLAVIWWWTG